MCKKVYFISHPEVEIDSSTRIEEWHLSESGIKRMKKILNKKWVKEIDVIFTSEENKAMDGGRILANYLGLRFVRVWELGEIDRSSTGFMKREEFWKTVREFYTNPKIRVRGWERAEEAQERIVKAVKEIVRKEKNKNIAIVSHGAVGALLLAYLSKVEISLDWEQPGSGGGNYFVFSNPDMKLLESWRVIDKI